MYAVRRLVHAKLSLPEQFQVKVTEHNGRFGS